MHATPLHAIFHPASITVVGGGNDLAKPGGRVVQWLLRGRFPRLSVVNAKGGTVQGLPTARSVEELTDTPELAIVSVPAPHVLGAVRALLVRGTRSFVVLSCGFSELDEAGKALEAELVATVREAGGALVGPNSMGVLTPDYLGLFGGPEFDPVAGSIDFISASGSTAAFVMEAGLVRGLRFASLVSVGNSAMLGVEDILAHRDETFESGPSKALLLYLEAIGDPSRILRHGRSLHRKGCRVVALKAGTTEVGARAASSHTGAMASRDAAVSALFDKAGIVRAACKTEMVDIAGLLACYGAPKGRRVAIVTHAGGPGIMLADELTKQGFEVPVLQPRTRERLASVLAPGSSTTNPVDILASGGPEHMRATLQIIGAEERGHIDAVCVIYGSPGLFDIFPVLQHVIDATRTLPMPVYPILPSVRTAARENRQFSDAGYYYFSDEVGLAQALGAIVRTPAPTEDDPALAPIDEPAIRAVLDRARARGARQLLAEEAERIVRSAGLAPPPSQFVATAADAASAAEALGFPVVLKVVGPSHKSDVQGVVLGLRDAPSVRDAARRLLGIDGATGVMAQKQVSGLELIVGASREGKFGHLVLFGLGGIFTEALRDVSTSLAPLSLAEARRAIGSIRGARLLDGYRGRAPVDREALARALWAVGTLVHRFPQIREMDVNPLLATGSELWAVDARIEIDCAER